LDFRFEKPRSFFRQPEHSRKPGRERPSIPITKIGFADIAFRDPDEIESIRIGLQFNSALHRRREFIECSRLEKTWN